MIFRFEIEVKEDEIEKVLNGITNGIENFAKDDKKKKEFQELIGLGEAYF
jgi:hypothetical protein